MLGDRFTLEYSPQFYDEISDAVREELLAFLDFLIFRQNRQRFREARSHQT